MPQIDILAVFLEKLNQSNQDARAIFGALAFGSHHLNM